MKVETYTTPAKTLRKKLLPKLMGSVFHMTNRPGYEGIFATGAILSNKDSCFSYTFAQSVNSYGRKRGYVCLFDLRGVLDGELDFALFKLNFLNPHHCADNPIFLILDEAFRDKLIPWVEGDFREVRIPHIECWYPTDIEVSMIQNVLDVRVTKRAQQRKRRQRA